MVHVHCRSMDPWNCSGSGLVSSTPLASWGKWLRPMTQMAVFFPKIQSSLREGLMEGKSKRGHVSTHDRNDRGQDSVVGGRWEIITLSWPALPPSTAIPNPSLKSFHDGIGERKWHCRRRPLQPTVQGSFRGHTDAMTRRDERKFWKRFFVRGGMILWICSLP